MLTHYARDFQISDEEAASRLHLLEKFSILAEARRAAYTPRSFTLQAIVGASFDPDRLRIEQRNGTERKYALDGETEAIQMIFEALVTSARR